MSIDSLINYAVSKAEEHRKRQDRIKDARLDREIDTRLEIAKSSADASRYGADKQFEGQKYMADKRAESDRYTAELNAQAKVEEAAVRAAMFGGNRGAQDRSALGKPQEVLDYLSSGSQAFQSLTSGYGEGGKLATGGQAVATPTGGAQMQSYIAAQLANADPDVQRRVMQALFGNQGSSPSVPRSQGTSPAAPTSTAAAFEGNAYSAGGPGAPMAPGRAGVADIQGKLGSDPDAKTRPSNIAAANPLIDQAASGIKTMQTDETRSPAYNMFANSPLGVAAHLGGEAGQFARGAISGRAVNPNGFETGARAAGAGLNRQIGTALVSVRDAAVDAADSFFNKPAGPQFTPDPVTRTSIRGAVERPSEPGMLDRLYGNMKRGDDNYRKYWEGR